MPKLKAWAGEASAVHWEQEDAGLPDIAEVRDRMAREGRPLAAQLSVARPRGPRGRPRRTEAATGSAYPGGQEALP